MIELKISTESVDALLAELNALLPDKAALEAALTQPVAPPPEPVAPPSTASAAIAQPPATPPVAPVAPLPEPVAPPSTASAAIAQPPATPPVVPVAAAPTYSRDQIMTAGAALIDAGKINELMGLLNAFGVQAVTQLKQDQLGAFATELRKLGAQL